VTKSCAMQGFSAAIVGEIAPKRPGNVFFNMNCQFAICSTYGTFKYQHWGHFLGITWKIKAETNDESTGFQIKLSRDFGGPR